jgi:hypothetical protein
MSIIKSGHAVHDANLLTYEQVRQAAVEVAGVTAAAVKSAHVSYFRVLHCVSEDQRPSIRRQ